MTEDCIIEEAMDIYEFLRMCDERGFEVWYGKGMWRVTGFNRDTWERYSGLSDWSIREAYYRCLAELGIAE